MTQKKKKLLKWLVIRPAIFLLILVTTLYFYVNVIYFGRFRNPCKLIISPETTYLTEPVQSDGTVDYIAALDSKASQGVTRENNAAVLVYQALGDDFIPKTSPTVLARLQLSNLDKSKCFIELDQFVAPGPIEDSMLSSGGPASYADWKSRREKEKNDPVYQARQKETENLRKAEDRSWTAKDFPKLAQWLQANKEPLDLMVRASTLPRFYIPIVTPKSPHHLSNLEEHKLHALCDLTKTLVARAYLRYGSGDIDGAWSDAIAAARLGQLIARGQFLLDHLAGRVMRMKASEACFTIARGNLTPRQVKVFLVDLQSLGPLSELGESLVQSERMTSLDSIQELSVSSGATAPNTPSFLNRLKLGKGKAYVDWNLILQRTNSRFDTLSDAIKLPNLAERKSALEAIDKETDELSSHKWSHLLRSSTEAMDYLVRVLICGKNYSGTSIDAEMGTMRIDVETLSTLLMLYRADHGGFPDKLESLCPDYYIGAVPKDRFTDEPLHYVRSGKGFILYSVGPNMKDDGGKDDENGGDDIVVKVE